MALSIDGATIGYDQNQMITTLNNVHNNCINRTKTALRTNLAQLRDEVHACWVGKSAETFLSNQEHDIEIICSGLDAAYAGLEAEFKKVIAGLAQIDQDLIQAR